MIVSVDNVTKSYKTGNRTVNALSGVTFDIHKGEFLAISGVSGSGKSTLLQLIGGLDKPTSGKVAVDGTHIDALKDTSLAKFRNETIGFVFQFFYLQPFLSLEKNIEIPGMFAGIKHDERQTRTQELLDKVGLTDQKKQMPNQLSGGQIQRAAIARALFNNPKILLADEPTGNLDSANGKMVIDLFKSIRDIYGTTIVIVSHDTDLTTHADREVQLHDGVLA